MLKLRSTRGDIDRHRNRTEPCAAQKAFNVLGAVGAHQRNAIAGSNSGGGECSCELRRNARCLFEGEAYVLRREKPMAAVAARLPA